MWQLLGGLLLPFFGTFFGAACVFLIKGEFRDGLRRSLMGFASGVMTAAAVWSLLIPAMEQSAHMGKWSFLPAVGGIAFGMAFLLVLDKVIPHLHTGGNEAEGPKTGLKKTTMMILAVTLHNIPEGMAVGVVYAGWLMGSGNIPVSAALTLAVGIAIQNFPEGAIISMPLRGEGMKKRSAFFRGALSGLVEPLAAVATILIAELIIPALPWLLGFAAGAMLYVVVEELIPEMSLGRHSNLATIFFAIGFSVMLVLDTVL